jgi:hypothetical protein
MKASEIRDLESAKLYVFSRCHRPRHWFSYRGGAGELDECYYCKRPKKDIRVAQRELRKRGL